MVGMEARLSRGRVGYVDQMTKADWAAYEEVLRWIHTQVEVGKLHYGWQTACSRDTQISMVTVSNVLTGKKTSPPILDRIHHWVRSHTGSVAPTDLYLSVDHYQEIVDTYDQRIAKLRQLVTDLETERDFELDQAQLRWERRIGDITKEMEGLYRPREQAYGALEQAIVRRDEADELEAYGPNTATQVTALKHERGED
jgi:exonuclease VII small subunit